MTGGVAAPPRARRLLAGLGCPPSAARLEAHLRTSPRPGAVSYRRAAPQAEVAWGEAVRAALERSGLTGRGGSGFPTARKVAAFRAAARETTPLGQRVVIVNLMEGEPASAKDRALAIGLPHIVLDGAADLAAAVGAGTVYVCLAAGSREATASVREALREREAAGVDSVSMQVVHPPDRYVAGEESALARWLDGGDARPEFRSARPSFPQVGGRPALVDNAETAAHVGMIARRGPGWFRSVGLPDAPGTTLLTVSGAVERPGVVEVALGTPLLEVVEDAGAAADLAGVLIGGYGGTWVPPQSLGVPLAPGPLEEIGSALGAGVVIALPRSSCALAETARIARWMAGESAGQCGPCAFGLPALADDVAALAGLSGSPSGAALRRLWFRLGEVEGRGACRHPDGVVRLLRSALGVFREDLERHLAYGPCAGVASPSILTFPRQGPTSPWR